MELCRLYPLSSVVALEPLNTSYGLGKKAITHSIYKNRIEFLQSYAHQLSAVAHFDVVSFPQMFFSNAHLIPSLTAILRAMKPGAFLTTGSEDSIAEKNLFRSIQRLKHVLNCGSFRSENDICQLLHSLGFVEVTPLPFMSGWYPITAQKSSQS
ncbi:MAG: hypothetical protein E6K54_06975 [Gammaproteobacteria bacterium]|nr:MAG: hypothetical protein E6K54_06975 [Gammaproteobacteria bacterium]